MSKTSVPVLDLRELLVARGKTYRQAGVDASYVVRLADGSQRPGANAVRKIAKALDVATDVVFAACQESQRRAHTAQPSTGGAQ